MAIPVQQYQTGDMEQVNPFGGALAKNIAYRLAQAQMEQEEKKVPYAGYSQLADILSKSAYANAVTPQMQLKAASNPAIWSQFSDPQKINAAKLAASNGNNQINPFRNLIQEALQVDQNEKNKKSPGQGVADWIMDKINGKTADNAQAQPVFQQQPQLTNEFPEWHVPKTFNEARQSTIDEQNHEDNNDNQPLVQESQPEETEKVDNRTPDEKNIDYHRSIEYAKSKAKVSGEETGKEIRELDDRYIAASMMNNSLNSIKDVFNKFGVKESINSPIFNKEITNLYSRLGDSKKKQLLGELKVYQNKIIGSSLSQLKGPDTQRHFNYINDYKINDDDNFDTRIGKLIALKNISLQEMELADLASQKMTDKKNPLSRIDAEKFSNEHINKNKINEQVENEVNPPVSIKPEDFTAENLQEAAKHFNMSVPEFLNALKSKGVNIPEGVIK